VSSGLPLLFLPLWVLFSYKVEGSSISVKQRFGNGVRERFAKRFNRRFSMRAGDVLAEARAMTEIKNQWDVEAFSPSKINLFLRVVKKRDDGFHDLGSLFQAISFGDCVKISKKNDDDVEDDFECNMPGVPTDESNLVIRAANLFREKTGIRQKLRISLQKNVPAQAGLGGGSGNAATTLWALNKVFDYPATMEELIEWSADLGSDITFFLSSGTAYCTGRGEILETVPRLPQKDVYIVKPSKGLSTPSVFKNLNYDELNKEDPRTILGKFYTLEEDLKDKKNRFVNDLEPPAFRLMPELKEIKDKLEEFDFEGVLMSGSGTSIFAIGDPRAAPVEIFFSELLRLKDTHEIQVHKARFINRGDGIHDWYQPVTFP